MTARRRSSARALRGGAPGVGQAAWDLHGPGLRGSAHAARPRARARRALPVPHRGGESRRRDGLEAVRRRHAAVQLRGLPPSLHAAAVAGRAPRGPRPPSGGRPRPLVQHGDLVRDQHQLAELLGRADDELPHPDVRPRGAELPLRGVGDGGADGPDPRVRAANHLHGRQLLGGHRPRHALHPAAALARPRARAGVARRGADPGAVQEGGAYPAGGGERAEARRLGRPGQGRTGQSGHRERHRGRADVGARSGRVADRDQAARHERRRVLQRQLGASVREPDAAFELPRGRRHPSHLGGACA